ncbi:hypothetical protein FRC17_004550 [Serendipita sp. 399]|nr:hypothetical protein FRC17_004550 [Serendipita sp. 399]
MATRRDPIVVTKGDAEMSESDEELYSQEYLDGLLEKAMEAAEQETSDLSKGEEKEEEFIQLQDDQTDLKPLPPLDAARLVPQPYFTNIKEKRGIPELAKDVIVGADTGASLVPPPLPPQPLINKDGKVLTKREMKELRAKQAKRGYFELPTPDAAELAKIQREAEAIRLRNSLDPKRFYRKAAAISLKNIPKQIALGTILPTTTPFGTASTDNLTRAERKRSIVEELVEDSEARRYAKRKFDELTSVREEKGKNTLKRKRLARKRKW